MKRYQSPAPRAAFAMAAIGMTAITLALSVIAPASMDADRADAQAVDPTSVAHLVAIQPAPSERIERIQVVGIRHPKPNSMQAPNAQPKRMQVG
jgi:hypothetical protein